MSGDMNRELGVTVREYRDSDEQSWVNARVQAFLDSSYRDDVQQYRERYENPSVRMVAVREADGEVVGFLDVEYERKPYDVCHFEGELGGVLWHLGVLPSYRRYGIADTLWASAVKRLKAQSISRVEAWTQDDEPANRWYAKQGFVLKHEYLNVYVRGRLDQFPLQNLLPGSAKSWKYGHVRNFNFEADVSHREELEKLSYRLHTVRGLEVKLA